MVEVGGSRDELTETTYTYSDLLRIPSFLKLWVGDILSQTADRMAFVAITVLAYAATDSSLGLSATMGAYFLPAVIVSVPGGVAADRYPRRTLMVAADGARVLIALLMALLNAGLWLLPLVLVFSSLTYFFYPSRQASIPCLVPDGALMPANAAISANLILGFAIGPLVAGLMMTVWGAQWTLVAAAIVMASGVAAISTIRDRTVCTPARSREESRWTSLSEGLADLRERTVLWQGFLLVVAVMLAVGAGAVGLVVFGDQVLGMGDEGFTLLLSALAVGTLSGAIVVGLRVPRFPKGRLLIAAALLAGTMLALLSRVDDLVLSVTIMLLVGVAAAMVLVPFSTMLQERLGDQVMGTSFGMLAVGLTAPMLVGIGLAGPIIDVWDAGTLFLTMGSMLVVAGLAALPLSSLWSEH